MEKLKMTDELKSILQSVKDGEVYAYVKSVSASGMSRRILFYRINTDNYTENAINKPYMQRITAEIGWLSGELEQEKYMQGSRGVYDDGLMVRGCGMDMIFHTLYNCIPYEDAKNWNQKYNLL
jgi:hypothetical protein